MRIHQAHLSLNVPSGLAEQEKCVAAADESQNENEKVPEGFG